MPKRFQHVYLIFVFKDCLQFVIVVFPDHTHLLFLKKKIKHIKLEGLQGRDIENDYCLASFRNAKRGSFYLPL